MITLLDGGVPSEPAARVAPELTPPDSAALRDEHGTPVENQQWFQDFADRVERSIYVRPAKRGECRTDERAGRKDEERYNKIVTDHLKGGEPLSPHQDPQLVWAP